MPPSGFQFTLREIMVAVAIMAAVCLFVSVTSSNVFWVGSASVPLEFLILDSKTSQPINAASIGLVYGNPEYRATTGPDGRARVVMQVMTAGRGSPWRTTRAVNYGFWALVVSAGGYDIMKEDLRKRTMDDRYHYEAMPPPIVIRLERSAEP